MKETICEAIHSSLLIYLGILIARLIDCWRQVVKYEKEHPND